MRGQTRLKTGGGGGRGAARALRSRRSFLFGRLQELTSPFNPSLSLSLPLFGRPQEFTELRAALKQQLDGK